MTVTTEKGSPLTVEFHGVPMGERSTPTSSLDAVPLRREERALRFDKLTVDPDMQRPAEPGRIRDMARNFVPEAVGSLSVSVRDDGMNVIIDGQHRYKAALVAGRGSQEAHCFCYIGLTKAQEAELFLLLNATRKPSKVSEFKMGLTAGHKHLIKINRVLSVNGWGVGTAAINGNVTAVAALLRADARDNGGERHVLERTFYVLSGAWGKDRDAVASAMLDGVSMFVDRYGDQIRFEDLIAKMQTRWHSAAALVAQARGLQSTLRTRSVGNCVGQLLYEAYNSGRSTNALSMAWSARWR